MELRREMIQAEIEADDGSYPCEGCWGYASFSACEWIGNSVGCPYIMQCVMLQKKLGRWNDEQSLWQHYPLLFGGC